MKKEFVKDYSVFSPSVLFKLFVKALARRDTPFMKRLVNACHENKGQFMRLLNAARECTLLVSLEIQVMVGKWEAFNATIEAVA